MPHFNCPIDTCKHWKRKRQDCEYPFIKLESRSDDWDVTLACPLQNLKDEEVSYRRRIF